MNSKPYFKIYPGGAVHVQPTPQYPPGQCDYSKKPVQIAIRRAPFGIELHGENFSAVADLSKTDALGLISMLSYWLAEFEYAPNRRDFAEVTQ